MFFCHDFFGTLQNQIWIYRDIWSSILDYWEGFTVMNLKYGEWVAEIRCESKWAMKKKHGSKSWLGYMSRMTYNPQWCGDYLINHEVRIPDPYLTASTWRIIPVRK